MLENVKLRSALEEADPLPRARDSSAAREVVV